MADFNSDDPVHVAAKDLHTVLSQIALAKTGQKQPPALQMLPLSREPAIARLRSALGSGYNSDDLIHVLANDYLKGLAKSAAQATENITRAKKLLAAVDNALDEGPFN